MTVRSISNITKALINMTFQGLRHGPPEVIAALGRGEVVDPATYYYRRVMTDAARAIDTVRERPEIDAARVAVTGGSQGGGLSLAAASEILKANLSRLDDGIAIAVFALTSILTVAAPIVLVFVAPDRATQRLEAWKTWLLVNSQTMALVVLMVVGAFLIFTGGKDLIA